MFRYCGSTKWPLCRPNQSAPARSRRKKALGFLEDLRSLDIVVDEEGFARILGDVHRLAVEQRLTAYDAAYLELAVRKQLPLASLDQDLNKAAVAVGVPLFQG
jgi:predicted nucleic acid-binding protein